MSQFQTTTDRQPKPSDTEGAEDISHLRFNLRGVTGPSYIACNDFDEMD